jgi:short-subunit dehydrogenase
MMSQFKGKTYWLIGASEGLGREISKKLSNAGAHLILSARNQERLESLSAELANTRVLALDVTDSVAVKKAITEVGSIDGVIYNVGAYEPLRATEWDVDASLMMTDVNFTGALRILGNLVPIFLRLGRGDITLIGSLAGYRGLPASIGYGASKAALISLAETMRYDLKGTGVVVRIVNPGFIKTRLTEKNSFKMPMLMSSERAATRVINAMSSKRFRTDFPAPFSWFIKTLQFIPDFVLYRGK